jgi:hypothetical protein
MSDKVITKEELQVMRVLREELAKLKPASRVRVMVKLQAKYGKHSNRTSEGSSNGS